MPIGELRNMGDAHKNSPLLDTHLALNLGQLIAHGDEELPVALALVSRQGEDTS